MSDFLPYGRQTIDDGDVAVVAEALRAELITQGPRVAAFEQAFADACGAGHAVAFANGTAALHAAAVACEIGPGDVALTTPISFVASSNCILYAGGHPMFGDIDPATLNLDVARARPTAMVERVKAVVVVSLAGLPADLSPLQPLRDQGIGVIEDACHALGARRGGRPVGGGGMADVSVFSLHPVKAITTGEGGVATTDDGALAERLRTFRTHGIVREHDGCQDPLRGPWHYDVRELGFNYRITDFQCALGVSQLQRLDEFISQRNRVAADYRDMLSGAPGLTLPPGAADDDALHAYHLFIVRFTEGARRRRLAYERLREAGIGTQLHYIPIYRHTLYRSLGYGGLEEAMPEAERYYAGALSLPIFPGMSTADVGRVAAVLKDALNEPLETAAPSGYG